MTIKEIVQLREDNERSLRNILSSITNDIRNRDFRSAEASTDSLKDLITEGRRINAAMSVRCIDTSEG